MNAQQIDWPGIRAAAVSVGVREAARQAGANLPPDEQTRLVERVMKRASRQKWLEHAHQAQEIATTTGPAALSANVRTGAQIVQNTLAERKEQTRTHLSSYAVKAARAAEDAPEPLKEAQNVRHVAAIMTALWPEEQTPGVNINLWGGGSMSQG